MGKPRGKATDPLIQAKDSETLLLLLGRKSHVHVPTADEDFRAWGDSRSIPRSMSALERNPQVPAPAGSQCEESRPYKVMRKEADIHKACSDFRDPSANS